VWSVVRVPSAAKENAAAAPRAGPFSLGTRSARQPYQGALRAPRHHDYIGAPLFLSAVAPAPRWEIPCPSCCYGRIEEGHLLADHVHMLISIPPKYAVSQVVGFIKGKSAIHLAGVYGEKKRNFVGQHFWARGYSGSAPAGRLDGADLEPLVDPAQARRRCFVDLGHGAPAGRVLPACAVAQISQAFASVGFPIFGSGTSRIRTVASTLSSCCARCWHTCPRCGRNST
jgi:hypothetical protein